MRYKIVCEQIMTDWYCTVRFQEADGQGFSTTVSHYMIPVHDTFPEDLSILLSRLNGAIFTPAP